MAPVTSKRRKTLPPLPERLVELQEQLERLGSTPAELCKALHHVLELDATWPYEKTDLQHWASVLDILDAALGKPDSDVTLLVAVLKFTRLLLENCNNRHVYNSYEHLKRLLEHDDCEVIMATLRVLSVLATPRSTRQVVCEAPFLAKLSSLSSIFSGGGTGQLSLAACCKGQPDPDIMADGTSVRVQFYRTHDSEPESQGAEGTRAGNEGSATVLLSNVHAMAGTDDEVYARVVKENNVPKQSEFHVRSKLRLARCFPDTCKRLQWVRVQVMATTVLAQCQAAFNQGHISVNESQLAELIGLCHPESREGEGATLETPPVDLQTLALKALTALLSERSRHTAALLSSTAAAHHGILSGLMCRAKTLVNDGESAGLQDRLKFGESLLAFTWMFASSSTGSNALNTAGIMSFLLPVLQDVDPRRGRFTTLAVKTLEVLMNYSPEIQRSFRDMDGLNILVDRAFSEVSALAPAEGPKDSESNSTPAAAAGTGHVEAGDSMVEDGASPWDGKTDAKERDLAGKEPVFTPFISKSAKADEDFERRKLLGQLMHLMASAGTPIATSADVRELMAPKKKLPGLLCKIFDAPECFGASVFEKAAALLTEFVHQEPSCLQHVMNEGVAECVLAAITSKLPISRGTVTIVPTVIGALCLSFQGSQFVESKKPVVKFLSALVSERVVPLLVGDVPSQLGQQLEELMRHNPPLLNSCLTGCVEIANCIVATAEKLAPEEVMSDASQTEGQPPTSQANQALAQTYLLQAIEFFGKLLEPLMTVPEHARSFVRNNGLAAVMKLISCRQIPRDFTRTEAGRFVVLVVGKTAFHSPNLVLGDVMQRTQEYLEELLDSSKSVKNDVTDKSADIHEVTKVVGKAELPACEGKLRGLELHLSLLSGIVGCLRGSSTATEWDNDKGKALIDSMARCYYWLLHDTAASTLPAHSSSAPTGAAPGVSVREVLSSDALSVLERELVSGIDDVAATDEGNIDSLDHSHGTLGRSSADAARSGICTDVAGAIAALLIRLSSSLGHATRRRQDDRNASAQAHEKALAGALIKSFKYLLTSVTTSQDDDLSIFSRAANAVLVTISLCLFGSQSVAPLTRDPHRSNQRGGVNMLLLQVFEQSGGAEGITDFLSRLINVSMAPKENPKVEGQLVKTVVRCFALCQKMLETNLTVVGRNGQSSPLPGFDAATFNATLKNKLFDALEPMWARMSPASWSPILAPRLLDLFVSLMKPTAAQSATSEAGASGASGAAVVGAPAQRVLPTFTHDPATVASLVEMGFSEARVHAALDVVRSNSVELATEWLFSHAEDEDEESSLAAAIALSMGGGGGGGSSSLQSTAAGDAAPAASQQSAPTGAEAKQPATAIEPVPSDAKDVCGKNADFIAAHALEWGLGVLVAGHGAEFSVVDMLTFLCNTREDERSKVIIALLGAIQEHIDDAKCRRSLFRALALLTTGNVECCRAASEQNAFKIVTSQLYAKHDKAECEQRVVAGERTQGAAADIAAVDLSSADKKATGSSGRVTESATEWVCSALLVLNAVLVFEEKARVAASALSSHHDTGVSNNTDAGSAAATAGSHVHDENGNAGGEELVGIVNKDKSKDHADLLSFCMRLLDGKSDADLLQAAMDLCARLTRQHDLALNFLHGGGVAMVLGLPESSAFAGQAIVTGSLIRHVLEDSVSLQLGMQSEIRTMLSQSPAHNARDNNRHPTVRTFLGNCANMVQRDPDVFAKAVRATCRIIDGVRGKEVALIDRKEGRDGKGVESESGTNESVLMGATLEKSLTAINTGGTHPTSSGAKSKAQGKNAEQDKRLESLNLVTCLLLNRLISDPRTSPKFSTSDLPASSTLTTANSRQASAEVSQSESMQIDVTEGDNSSGNGSSSPRDGLPAISPANLLKYLADLVKFFPMASAVILKYTFDSTLLGKAREESKGKERESFVHYLLRVLMPNRGANAEDEGAKWLRVEMGRRATSLTIALLSRSNEVRKRIMGEIVTILNAPPKDRATVHLHMLQSLASVLLTFLTAKGSPASPHQVLPETVQQFFDAQVPSGLCAAIASIDLHHPDASKVGSALLRPLEILCANSHLADLKSSNSRADGGTSAVARRRAASDRASSHTSRVEGNNRPAADAEHSHDREAGTGADEISADVSVVVPRLDDSGASVRESMLMALTMHEDEDEDGDGGDLERNERDDDVGADGSDHDEMRQSDEGDDSEDEGEGDDGGESGAEMETEGSQQDDDENDGPFVIEGGERDWEGGGFDDDHPLLAGQPLQPAVDPEDLQSSNYWPDDVADELHNQIQINRHDLDSMLQQLMEGEDMQMNEEPMDMMDRVDMIADIDVRDNSQHQVLSLLVPGGGGGGRDRVLQHLLPLSGLTDHLQVIRLPSGRSGRGQSGVSVDQNPRNALHEVPAAEHPLLARGGGASARETSDGVDFDVGGGISNELDRISRHIGQEIESSIISGAWGWPPGGARFLVDPPGGLAAGFGREETLSGIQSNRWSEDGGSSSATMRTAAQQMENRIVAMLAAAAPASVEPAASDATPIVDASAARPAIVDTETASAISRPLPDESNSFGAQPAIEAVEGSASAGGNEATTDQVAMDVDTASGSTPRPALADTSVAAPSTHAAPADPLETAPTGTTQTGAQEGRMSDAMDEDEDEDELQAALRMSMQADQEVASGSSAADGPPAAAGPGMLMPLPAVGDEVPDAVGSGDGIAEAGAGAGPSAGEDISEVAAGAAEAGAAEAGAASSAEAADGGIDPAFLAELPEDLRAEVMAQQARQNAVASLATSAAASAIDPEFLAALPPDIQADVIRQHEREAAAAAAAAAPQDPDAAANRSEEMDNASFIASLAPDLREEVLVTSNEEFLQTLPPHLVAEAHLLRERHMTHDAMTSAAHSRHSVTRDMSRRQQPMAVPRILDPSIGLGARGAGPAKAVARQVIEDSSVEHILELLFVAQPVLKSLMNKILLHMTAHTSSLEATVRFLLKSILQACGAGKLPPEMYGCSHIGHLSDNGNVAVLQAKRALEALCHVTSQQPNVCARLLQQGFLEDSIVQRFHSSQAKAESSKGKQKMEAADPATTPFALLIWVLATGMFSKSTALQEQVLHVLNCALQPVTKKIEDAAGAATNNDTTALKPTASYPRLGMHDLTCLTSTLAVSGNSAKMMERWTNLLKTLCHDSVNLVTCTAHLVSEAKAEAELSRAGMQALAEHLRAQDGDDMAGDGALSAQHKHDVRLLRIVRTLRAIWPAKDDESEGKGQQEDTSQPLADVVCLDDLWDLLGGCLSELEKDDHLAVSDSPAESAGAAGAAGGAATAGAEGQGPRADAAGFGPNAPVSQMTMSPVLLRLQPLVEAFLVVKAPDHENDSEKKPMTVPGAMEVDKGGEGAAEEAATSPSAVMRSLSKIAADDVGKGVKDFVTFAEQHRKTLNLFIRQDKALLHTLAYAPLVRFPKLIDFDNKKHYLRSELKRRNANQRHPNIRLNVRRESVFEDSFHQVCASVALHHSISVYLIRVNVCRSFRESPTS